MEPISDISPATRRKLQQCYEYGNQKMQIGDHNAAAIMFAQCVNGDPSNILYMQSFVANLRLKFGHRTKKKGWFKQSKLQRVKTKDFKTTIKECVDKLGKDPWDEQTYVTMGEACLEEGYDEAGLAYLKLALDCDPDNVEINRLAATELGDRRLFEQAIACWERVLKNAPNDVEASRKIADLMLERTIQKVQQAPREEEEKEQDAPKLSLEDQIEKRIRKNDHDRDAYVDLVDYFFQKGNLRKTEDSCKRALKVFPDDDLFMTKLLEVQKTRASEELKRLREQYEKNPTDAIKEKYAEQKKIFDQKTYDHILYRLKKSPNESALHWELGRFLMGKKQYKEAIAELQKAKVDDGLAGVCLLALAECFQQIKQYTLASLHYDQAVEKLDAQSEEIKRALYNGARLALGLNNVKKASDFANRLAAIDFSYKDVGALLDKITKRM